MLGSFGHNGPAAMRPGRTSRCKRSKRFPEEDASSCIAHTTMGYNNPLGVSLRSPLAPSAVAEALLA